MRTLRKDNRFRFTLQWSADTQERVAAGEFLERLANKKSDVIVLALWEYLERHPEAMAPDAQIKITTQPIYDRAQILAELKGMVRSYVNEVIPSLPLSSNPTESEPVLSADDLDSMLDNLDVFE